jgi:hypothetical protein
MGKLPNVHDDGYELDCGEAAHDRAPATFWIPDLELRVALKPGAIVKLIFRIALSDADGDESVEVESMWVQVRGKTGDLYRGELDNDPYCTDDLQAGHEVFFEARHVIQIHDS